MAALTGERKIEQGGDTLTQHPVLAAMNIYKGAIVVRQNGQLYVQPAAAGLGNAVCEGVALNFANNASGASGDLTVDVAKGVYKFANGDTITTSHKGCLVYASDDQTVIKGSTGTHPPVGTVVDVDSDGVWVKLGFEPGDLIVLKSLTGHADLTAAATTQVVTLGILPPNCRLLSRELNGTVFSGGGTAAASVDIGGTDADGIVDGADIFTGATLPKRGTDGVLGADFCGDFGGQTITATFIADTTVAAFTAGSLEITLIFAKAG